MPYIPKHKRFDIYGYDNAPLGNNAGELNYILTTVIDEYWHQNGQNYQAFNDILGALEGAKLEIYRRKIAPYEDRKLLENGDVYNENENR